MTTSTTLNEIQATPKQYFGLAGKFAYLICESLGIPEIKFPIIRKRCLGVLYSQFPASSMTRGKAQELFEISTVPAYLTRKVKTEDMVEPKAPVKVKATKKVAKRTATKKVAKRTATKVAKKSTPKVAAKAAPSDLEKRMAFVEGEVSKMSEDVNLIKSTLDQLVTQLKLA
jgi:hypothetical protein|tara:strand:- start:480 stop:992 length:513 start_codon:yes stop_codon:yes gene_type:complete